MTKEFETKVVITFKLNNIIEKFFLINMSTNYLKIDIIKRIELHKHFNSKIFFENLGWKIDSTVDIGFYEHWFL